ncbi:MAG: GNAT family N-acetyltransferase [Herpetosiphonaceae bacterium]|nr:GNAT family N-acetyltransferase [Herpetosiphonaceae bacterium]
MSKKLDIAVRALEPDDYIDLTILYSGPNVVAGSLYLPHPPQDLWRRRAEGSDSEMPRLVAAVEGMVVGAVSMEIGEGRRRHSGTIEMAVRDDYQGRGVGAALLTAIVDLAEHWLGLRRLELVVFTDNNPAIALYKRFNFTVEGTLRQYAYRSGGLADVYTMARLTSLPEA